MSDQRAQERGKRSGELESLMQRYQQSDGEAAAMLVAQLSPQIYNFFRAREQNREVAEDLVQDFWLRVHTAKRTYRPLSRCSPGYTRSPGEFESTTIAAGG